MPAFVKLVGQTANGASSATIVVTVAAGGVPVGNTVIITLNANGNGTVNSVADTQGNTWSIDRQSTSTTGGQLVSSKITTALQAGDTITVTGSASIAGRIAIAAEFSGVAGVDVQDSATGTGTTATGSTIISAVHPSGLAVASFGEAVVTDDFQNLDANYTEIARQAGSSSRSQLMAYRITNPAGVNTATCDFPISQTWRAGVAIYLADDLDAVPANQLQHPSLSPQNFWEWFVPPGFEAATAAGTIFDQPADDSVGLTDSTVFEYQWVRTDDAGLTDTTAFTEALVRTDDAGLTDSATQALVKSVDQTDSVGLTDSVAFTESLVRTDSAGLTDSALLQQELVRTDSTGLTDSSTIQVVKAVTGDDPVGLTDTTAFTEQLVRTDLVGLTDTTALTEQLVRTDSVGLTDTSTAGLLRDVSQIDSAGLTDSALFAELLIRTDLVGLTDTVVLSGSASPAGVGTMTPVRLSVSTMAAGGDRAATTTPGVLAVPGMALGDDRSADMTPATKAVPTTTGG